MNKTETKTNSEILAGFIEIARGIPDNWPEYCVLDFIYREDGTMYLQYYGKNDVKEGITIGQWKELLKLKI